MTERRDETGPTSPSPPGPGSPAVSVVVPARDDAEHLARCLRLLAAQTRPADEVVVVDNASIDGTADVARAAGARVVFDRNTRISQDLIPDRFEVFVKAMKDKHHAHVIKLVFHIITYHE